MLPTPTTFRPESLVGTVLDGRYRLLAHLASGGMGAIFRAEHVYMRKELALKLLRPDLSSLPDIAERFRREAEIVASLEHENIVRVTDFGRSPEGWLFLAMELLEGESLFERLRDGPLGVEDALRILVQVCRGLEAAHARGVVHRDLKPENVFLTWTEPPVVKVLDFGIAKLTDPQVKSDTHAGIVVGTPEYLSPEQAAGAPVDARADLYAVGLVGWRALAGRHPFQAADARGLLLMQATQPVPPLVDARPDLAAWPALLAALGRACAKEPGDRHATAADLRAELEACLGLAALPALAPARTPPRPQVPAVRAAPAPVEETLALGPSVGVPLPGAGRPRRGALRAARPWLALAGLAAAALLLLPSSARVTRWVRERPLAEARNLLASNRPEAARAVLAPEVARRPEDARIHLLQGRALHRIPGEAAAGVDAYAAAAELDRGALDDGAYADLTRDLAGDRMLAERAARVLARAGPPAVPAVIAATHAPGGAARLRALELARELGAEDRLDVVGAYTALLRDEDCEVRRAAARRLGELGRPEAEGALSDLARSTRRIRGLFGLPQRVPTCGAPEAEAALRRLARR